MDNAGYAALTRQTGLLREMRSVANNMANISTTGYRRGSVVFSEFVQATGPSTPSLSMAAARIEHTDLGQAPLTQTGARFDLAIEGQGYFLVGTPQGDGLTRAGAFSPTADGRLVNPDGYALRDAGGADLFVPPGVRDLSISSDGTVAADGNPIGQIGLWQPAQGASLQRQAGVYFLSPDGVEPALNTGTILQGYLENSNVNPVTEIARMIEVQRAYELGQNILDKEDERIRSVLRTLGR